MSEKTEQVDELEAEQAASGESSKTQSVENTPTDMSLTESKAVGLSFSEQGNLVNRAFLTSFMDRYDEEGRGPYITAMYDDSLIVSEKGIYYKVGYAISDKLSVSFDPVEDWVKVEPRKEWLAVSAELERRIQKSKAPVEQEVPATKTTCELKAIKVIDAATRRIGLYVTVWNERDCQDDRMQRKAVEKYVGKGQPLMLWLHGFDPEFGAEPVGVWDVSSFKLDDFGWYAEGNISFDKYGNLAWKRLEASKSVAGSLGSIWYLVDKVPNKDGTKDIIDWPPLEISIMEGGKQCVPSARASLKAPLFVKMNSIAEEFGRPLPDSVLEEEIIEPNPEGEIMSETLAPDVQALVQQELKKIRDAERKAAAEEAARKAEIEKLATEMLQEQLPEIRAEVREELIEKVKTELAAEQEQTKEELVAAIRAELQAHFDEEKAKIEAEHQKALTAARQKNLTPIGGDAQPVIKMWTPHDRLTTTDLCIRYEVLRSYGIQPSDQFVRVLEDRAKTMAKSVDVLETRNGRQVTAPAIDFDALVPQSMTIEDLSIDEDEDPFANKANPQFWRQSGLDTPVDNVTKNGVRQLATLAAKANELNYSTQAGGGDEWVPTLMAATLWREIRLAAPVLGLFPNFNMPSQPYEQATESTDPTFFNVAEATNEAQMILTGSVFGNSKIGTSKITYTAGKMGGLSYWSEEMNEDSIIAFEPQVADQYGIAMAHAIDSILVNGDESTGTGNISLYGGTITAANKYLVLDGLRHAPLVTTTTDAYNMPVLDYQSTVHLRSLMGTNGKYGLSTANVVFLCDPATYYQFLTIDEVLTVDKFGSAATILRGQLAALGGISIIVSEDMVLTDTSGYINNTGGSNTKGSVLAVHRGGWRVGWRRRPRVRILGLPGSDARYIVASARFDIQPYKAGFAALGYNIDLTS